MQTKFTNYFYSNAYEAFELSVHLSPSLSLCVSCLRSTALDWRISAHPKHCGSQLPTEAGTGSATNSRTQESARAHLGPKNALAQAAFSWLASYLMLADPIRSNLLLIDACAESLVEICAQLRLKQRYLSIYRRFQRCIWANAATSVARWLCFTHFHFRFSSMAFLGLQFR